MKIGFDAKRAFHNNTGLGNYSRGLIHALAQFHPQNQYFLFNPKPSHHHQFTESNTKEIRPAGFFFSKFHAFWRSYGILNDIHRIKPDLFHGLSHEIPMMIRKTGIRTVVTIHDMITFRYPRQFSIFDAFIHQQKIKYACENADMIIAISEQTKKDIIEYLRINPLKIKVCYQHCDTKFSIKKTELEKKAVSEKFDLPENYFLYVGSIIERKNLLRICEAMKLNQSVSTLPLVVLGNGGRYKETVKSFLQKNGMENKVIFLSEKKECKNNSDFISGLYLPELFQSATALVYPSEYEGFGIPVLEALWSGTPVITSSTSCLPEAGGPGSLYVDPKSTNQIAQAMIKLETDEALRKKIIMVGKEYALNFTPEISANNMINAYQSLL